MEEITEIDARGLRCPLPVLRAQKRLREMAPGTRLRLLADDPMARIDLPHFCAEAGHELLSSEESGETLSFLILRGAPDAQS
ncbi:tRNA 2-thiouridine synthesizing protein A [Pseudooceanicola antarcticus]|uniref:Sulfurtransferase TusA family protein n=1 Tax=Pseudooceanicola antarcticus TaxID=1247613 RepID=A0A285IYT6_9RHOB|nr:sulfurtransferase TusA family protein [Pseudooceanicola antarcticus]PJE25720.1 sulfurtransferase TusA family protein [Pseudooceanicola antarcticus]SNY53128.1 tRNA 2-thiouridine synthesizing protein A [Pseudooceanicola antarcticus]